MIQMLIPALSSLLGNVIDRAIPDKDKAAELKAAANTQLMTMEQTELQGAIDIIKLEAGGGSWIKQNWRPLTMLSFLALLFLYWFGVHPENMAESTINELFGLIKLGLSGYIIGRSAEKIVPEVAKVIKKKT